MPAKKFKIVTGDRVKVIRGNHKGSSGEVLRVIRGSDRVVVQGVNMQKRHTKPTQANPEGGIITSEGSIHISNVMLIDPSNDEASRVRIKVNHDGDRRTTERIATRSGNPIARPE